MTKSQTDAAARKLLAEVMNKGSDYDVAGVIAMEVVDDMEVFHVENHETKIARLTPDIIIMSSAYSMRGIKRRGSKAHIGSNELLFMIVGFRSEWRVTPKTGSQRLIPANGQASRFRARMRGRGRQQKGRGAQPLASRRYDRSLA